MSLKSLQVGHYDTNTFRKKFLEVFASSPKYNFKALNDVLVLLDMIARDPCITDRRWAAYMLATVMWETTSLETHYVQAKDKKGHPLFEKSGHPIMLKRKAWVYKMAPVDEVGHGKGRRYHEPVKVMRLDDGGARITEPDCDQFSISKFGVVKRLTKHARMGSQAGGPHHKTFDQASGQEHAYFGRGYVQLTWWSNYASMSVALKRGLDLLLHPEQVKTPRVSYEIMSYGMRTGFGFANGHKFSNYFCGQLCDYVNARKMVNALDHADEIAEIAHRFEYILKKSSLI
ncbi:hypothetical protein [Methylobacterium sp. 285MFTsu5.1]|uniref:hypothetical protein n=1 Tax=Methylobacterium sp. 285MFTsu5.1 TaxID=1172187 RepID=UPI0018F89076|nr:hypothetical protein [Methylobacterium sp. 285MFTsu5.1]